MMLLPAVGVLVVIVMAWCAPLNHRAALEFLLLAVAVAVAGIPVPVVAQLAGLGRASAWWQAYENWRTARKTALLWLFVGCCWFLVFLLRAA